MSKTKRRLQAQKRRERVESSRYISKVGYPCRNCGELGAHFVPPCFGDPGFFHCAKSDNTAKGEVK